MIKTLVPWEARRALPLRRIVLWSSLTVLLAALVGALEQSREPTGAPDRSLAFALGVLVPLAAVAAVLRLCGDGSLRHFGSSAARYGTNRRAGVLKSLAMMASGLVLVACVSAGAALLASRPFGDPRLVADLVATTPVAAATALAYLAWMAAGATFGMRGGGVLLALLVDWLAGATALPVAWATPRGHARHLLGLEAAFGFPPWVSFAALLSLTAAAAALIALRVAR